MAAMAPGRTIAEPAPVGMDYRIVDDMDWNIHIYIYHKLHYYMYLYV